MSFSCPECGRPLPPETAAGDQAECPYCGFPMSPQGAQPAKPVIPPVLRKGNPALRYLIYGVLAVVALVLVWQLAR